MMRSKILRAILILLGLSGEIASLWFCSTCFFVGQYAYGLAVAVSMSIVFVCILVLQVKAILDIEMLAYEIRGEERGRVACSCSYRDFEADGGELVFYDRGMAYEREGQEPLGILSYEKFSHAVQDDNAVMAFVANSIKARVLTVEMRTVLKAKAVMNLMADGGIPVQ